MRWLLDWLIGLFGRTPAHVVAIEADTPDVVKDRTLHLVGERNSYWLAIMKCPCGCGAIIQLPMSGLQGPRWSVSGTKSAPTLTPSVHRTQGCRSHFFLRQGRIVWCR